MKKAPYTVLSGNRRRVAVEALGWETVPAIVVRKNGHGQERALTELPVRDLAPNTWNPRDEVQVDSLTNSIREIGLLAPITVTPNDGSSVLTEPDLAARLWAEQNEHKAWPPAASVEFYKRVRAAMTNGRRKKLDTLLRMMGMTDSERRIYGGAARLGPETLAFCRDQGLTVSNMNHIANYAARTLERMGSLPPSVSSDRIQLLVARKYALPHGGIPRGEKASFVEGYIEALDKANPVQVMVFLTSVGATISDLRLGLGLSRVIAKRTHADAITRAVKSIENLARLNIDMAQPAHKRAMRQLFRAFKELRANTTQAR